MARDRGPEEFFEVFREVQASKKRAEEGDAAQPVIAAPDAGQPKTPARERRALPESLDISYPVAAAFVVGALLLVVAAYLLGKQHGYALAKPAGPPPVVDPKGGTSGPSAVTAGPEVVDGKIFRLLFSGTGDRDRASVEKEVEYLNSYEEFRALGVTAFLWRDKSRHYWLCVRGLADLSAAERDRVRGRIRALRSSRGQREYAEADFFRP